MQEELKFEYKVFGEVTKVRGKKILGLFTTRHSTNYSKKVVREVISNFYDKYCFMMTFETFQRLGLEHNQLGTFILIFDEEGSTKPKSKDKINVYLKNTVTDLRLRYLYKDLFISNKSDNILILEATKFSKNLNILTLYAQGIGKEVFVLPGRIDSDSSEGTNRLIFDGANPFYTLDLLNI